ncbi:hypothetical protein R3W88_013875 [Solanum pinnatisectum]|uniref:Uncharacterized protein n=1 Tax=Solanum pinnatisectum TaxID=50273 RepID=A0AAV9KQ51_9SOLN|nr:hypothetical protein R3W88_013875 [Solanum pinnatisectum]
MEKGKNIEMELTEEDLRRKLHRLKQEIQEARERRIEVEIATAIARVANTALDEELAAKMARYATLNKETVAMRKEHDVFNKDITRRLQKIHEKCSFFNQEANSGPEDTYPETTEEDTEEEIVYRPPFQGRWKEGNEKITLKAGSDSFPVKFLAANRRWVITPRYRSTDVVVAQPVVADQNELIVQLMQQIAEMRVEMQRRQDLPNPAFIAPADGRPSLHFPPPSAEQAHNPSSSPAHNPAIIDLTTQNPHYASASYQTPPPPQNTNFQMPPPPQNANLQTGPPPQSQNVNHPQTYLRHQNQHTNTQNFRQNDQATQNAQSPPLLHHYPKTTFQIPVPNEHDVNGSELDHYEEREREWRSKEEIAKLDMKEEIRKAMKELQCIPEVAGLNYEDLCIHPNLDLPEGFTVPMFDIFGGTGTSAHLRAHRDQLVESEEMKFHRCAF